MKELKNTRFPHLPREQTGYLGWFAAFGISIVVLAVLAVAALMGAWML